MSVTGKRSVGIPTILMHDSEGTIVTIELKTGETYRGLLEDSEDNMNCTMRQCIKTAVDGTVTRVESAYLRGSHIAMFIFPEMLKTAPMFRRVKVWKAHKGHPPLASAQGGVARGQGAAILRKAQERMGGPIGRGGPPMGMRR